LFATNAFISVPQCGHNGKTSSLISNGISFTFGLLSSRVRVHDNSGKNSYRFSTDGSLQKLAVRLPHHSNYFSKVIYLFRALGRCVVPRASVGLAGARPPLALAWPLASCKFNACAALLRLLAAAAQPKAAASKSTSLIMSDWPLLPLQHSKNPTDAANKASPE